MKRWAVALCSVACGGGAPDPEPIVVENVGRICVFSTNPKDGTSYFENLPVAVRFSLEGTCLSSGCTRDRVASCAISTSGATHQVTTFARWTDASGSERVCTHDCLILGATCQTDPLPAGTHTFVLGSQTLSLTIPSQLPEPLCTEN